MYEKFYNLKQNPFSLSPDPQFLCMTGQHREALSALVYSVCTRPGLTLLVGEAGTGKTTLLYTLLKFLQKKQYAVGMCTNPRLSREEFYDYLLAKLDVPCNSPLRSRQLIALQETLMRNRAAGRMSVLIVDEAQRLHPDLMEEIRLLSNLETPREKLLQIIVAGQPELMDILRRSELRQLKQRINYFCSLQPLNIDELREYLQHRLLCAGISPQTLFSEPAIQAIFEYTRGIPRLINSLCDNALQTGFAVQSPQVTVSIIQEAAAGMDLSLSRTGRGVSEIGKRPASVMSMQETPKPSLAVPSPVLVPDTPENNPSHPVRVPFESYGSRQKSLGFLGGLLDRWR